MQFEILPVTRFEQNCSILWCEETRRAAVIDPGGDVREILNLLEMLDLEAEVALVTHGHFDHCGVVAQFAELTGARIEGPHHHDAGLIERLPSQPAMYARQALTGNAERDQAPRLDALMPATQALRSFEPRRWLMHTDSVRFGNEELQVLHCPGHTPGHVAYFSATRRTAFVGDILFRHAIGAWEHSGGDLPTLIDSIREKLFKLGDDVAFVPGHGPTSTFGHERQENPFVGDVAYAAWHARCDRAGIVRHD